MAQEFPRNSKERELSQEAKELIRLFKKANEAKPEEQEVLFQEFARKLVEIVTPKGQEPHVGEMLHYMRGIAEGRREPRFYIGSGTAGQRILFDNYVAVSKKDQGRIARWGKNAKRIDPGGDMLEFESIDRKPRWMRYPKPEGENWKFGKDYWEQYMKVFGRETVDLLEDFESNRKG